MVQETERFELLKHLGTGAFGQTWRVRVIDPILIQRWKRDEVAIKIPLSREKEEALETEATLLGSLMLQPKKERINIIEYLGIKTYDGKIVMVMKYYQDGNLRDVIGKLWHWKKMRLEDAIPIALGILNGISMIHKHHILHRDIKPENILMDDGIPKIADFGISRHVEPDEMASTAAGALYYMSPELLFGKCGYSFNTDIWSFGITFYEMLCGRFPFGIEKNMPQGKVMDMIRDSSVKVLFPKEVAIPVPLQSIILKALDRNPHSRYKTADSVLKDITSFISQGDKNTVKEEIEKIRSIINDPTQAHAAESKLKEIMGRFPDSPLPCRELGMFYNRYGDYDRAIEMFRKGIEKDSDNARLHFCLAISYHNKGDSKHTSEALKKSEELGLEKDLTTKEKAILRSLKKKV